MTAEETGRFRSLEVKESGELRGDGGEREDEKKNRKVGIGT